MEITTRLRSESCVENTLTPEGCAITESRLKEAFSQGIVVVGLVRNCGESVRKNVSVIANSLRRFSAVHWLLIESDSSDDTVDVLRALESEIRNFRFISLGRLQDQLPLRTERIAFCRNRYLEEFLGNPSYSDAKYLVVADLDGVNERLTEQAFLSCWEQAGWAGCMANQSGPYYDIYALRHRLWSPNDALLQSEFFAQYMDKERALSIAVQSRMIRIPPGAQWIEVDSAFGGLAVYKRDAIGRARYCGLDEQGRETCEHVSFHQTIRDNGSRLYINPKLLNAGYTEHSKRYAFQARLRSKLKRFIKTFLGRN